jgi:5'-nucleotidase (lipoprotein e(P4) family)
MQKFFLILLAIYASGCTNSSDQINILQSRIDSLEKTGSFKNSEYLIQAVLWFQRSPEMRALYMQSYHNAQDALDANLKHPLTKKRKAVVVDIDETLLDNSPYEAWLAANDSSFTSSSWSSWINDAKAKPLPGALNFLNYAKKRGCAIFYVSNRKKEGQFDATLKNLVDDAFPDAEASHLLLKTAADTATTSAFTSKEQRRRFISDQLNYEIILLCGDQLADLDKSFNLFAGATENSITDSLNKYSMLLGKKYIALPNPMYGDWLSLFVYQNNQTGTAAHLDSMRKEQLKKWK